MRIDEVESGGSLDPNKLMGLVNFLSGRADNENAQKQISTQAFISAAQSLGFPINDRNIVSVVSTPTLGLSVGTHRSQQSWDDHVQRF